MSSINDFFFVLSPKEKIRRMIRDMSAIIISNLVIISALNNPVNSKSPKGSKIICPFRKIKKYARIEADLNSA